MAISTINRQSLSVPSQNIGKGTRILGTDLTMSTHKLLIQYKLTQLTYYVP